MEDSISSLRNCDQIEWEKRFEELSRQAAEKEIFVQIWFPNGLLRSTVSRLRLDASVIHLDLPHAKHHGKYCAEIVIQPPEPMGREFQLCETSSGQVFLWMEQEYAILEISNSLELLELLTTDAKLQ